MQFNNPELVTWIILLLALGIVAQAVFIAFVLHRAKKQLEKTQANLEKSSKLLLENLSQGKNLLLRIQPLVGQLPYARRTLGSFLDSVTERASRSNVYVDKKLAAISDSIDQADRRLEYALGQFARQTTRVRRSIHYPLANLSALFEGVLAAVREYRGTSGGPDENVNEEESFI